MNVAKNEHKDQRVELLRRFLGAVALLSVVFICFFLLARTYQMLLVSFAGLLFGIFLRSLSKLLNRYTGLSEKKSLGVVVVTFLTVAGLLVWFLAESIGKQVDQFSEQWPRTEQQLLGKIERFEWGKQVLEQRDEAAKKMASSPQALSTAKRVLSGTFDGLVGLLVVFSIGCYLAIEPRLYREGFLKLFPLARRDDLREVLLEIGHKLQFWLVGRVTNMVIIGTLTTIGLLVMKIPMAVSLGVLAGLLTFIPFFGPITSAIPAVLVAAAEGGQKAAMVIGLYVAVQMVDNFVLEPLVEKKTVKLPPALTISFQMILGVLAGVLGILFATPILVVIVVAVKMLYIEGTLNDHTKVLG